MARWWLGPRLRTDEDEMRERRTSWLELFYDLVFVAVITHLSLILSSGVTARSFFEFLFLFIPCWWTWVGGTIYNERFEADDVSHRLFVFAQMVPVLGLAVNVQGAFGDRAVQFAISYVASRLILIALYVRAGYHEPRARPLTYRYITGFSASAVLWTVSIFVPGPGRYWLWAVGMLIDLATPLFTRREQAQLPGLSSSHLPERFGLFVMIVLGESVLAVVIGIAALQHVPFYYAVVANFGLAIVFGIWWSYFDQGMGPVRPQPIWWMVRNYVHLPLTMAIVAMGASIRVLTSATGMVADPAVRWLACGSVAVALACIALLQIVFQRSKSWKVRVASPALKFAAGVFALAVAAFGTEIGTAGLLAMLALLVAMHPAFDAYLWSTRAEAFAPTE